MEEYRPFATKLRADLYRRLKLMAAAQDTSIQKLLEEAVIDYLQGRKFSEESHMIKESQARYSVSFEVEAPKKGKPRKV